MATLESVLSPVPLGKFFSDYWTKMFLHIPGTTAKFADLYSWDVLSNVLNEHRFGPNRLGMMKAGQPLDYSRYLTMVNGQIHPRRLLDEFNAGATIILNHCEETYAPLRDFCGALERLFHVGINVNLYAVRGHDNAFDIHWDEQDTLILQLAGRKQWKVWPPTREYPFKQDVVDTPTSTTPTGRPAWEGILEHGGLLSIPRGWWHSVYPIGTPSLHLTVTIKTLTGIDFLHWLVNKTKNRAIARMPLPVIQTDEAQRAWLLQLRRALARSWSDDLISEYLMERDRQARLRPSIRLHQHATERSGPAWYRAQLSTAAEDDAPSHSESGASARAIRDAITRRHGILRRLLLRWDAIAHARHP